MSKHVSEAYLLRPNTLSLINMLYYGRKLLFWYVAWVGVWLVGLLGGWGARLEGNTSELEQIQPSWS